MESTGIRTKDDSPRAKFYRAHAFNALRRGREKRVERELKESQNVQPELKTERRFSMTGNQKFTLTALAILLAFVAIWCHLGYANGFDVKDLVILLGILGFGGATFVRGGQAKSLLWIILVPWLLGANAFAADEHLAASVRVENGGNSCSGTIISRGEKYAAGVSCGHCFSGVIGGKFTVKFKDGASAEATLLAVDAARDLSLFRIDASRAAGFAQIAASPESGAAEAVGYTGGGPQRRKPLTFSETKFLNGQYWRWTWIVGAGEVCAPGDSGGGVFLNGQLCGVISHHGTDGTNSLYCCAQKDLVEFVTANEARLRDCGQWLCPRAKPQQPITPKPPGPYDGKGPAPDELNTHREQAAAIAKMQTALAELDKRLVAVETRKPEEPSLSPPQPPVLIGPRGEKGEPGKDADPTELSKLRQQIAELQSQLAAVKLQAGPQGPPGKLNVILTDDSGKELKRAENVESGSVVRLAVSKFLKSPEK